MVHLHRRRLLGEAAKAGQALDLQIQTDTVSNRVSLRDPINGNVNAKGYLYNPESLYGFLRTLISSSDDENIER